jgi:hypothetical protein
MPSKRSLVDHTLPFGKYKGYTLLAVWEHDPAYITWLSTQAEWMPQRFPEINELIGILLTGSPTAAAPRRAKRFTKATSQTQTQTSPATTGKRHNTRLTNAKFLSKFLTNGKITPGVCYAFLRINAIADKHEVLESERERALANLDKLQAYDSELVIEAAAALTDMDHGFAKVPKVADVLTNLQYAARAKLELAFLVQPKPRAKVTIRRPGSVRVGAVCRVKMPGEGWLNGRVAACRHGDPDTVEVTLDNGRIVEGPANDPSFELL